MQTPTSDRSTPSPPAAPWLRCDVRPNSDGVVVALCGELDVGSVALVEHHLADVRLLGFDRVVVDLSGVTLLGSVGVRLLVDWASRARREGWLLDVRTVRCTA
jgi:anti-anti-sigma factor